MKMTKKETLEKMQNDNMIKLAYHIAKSTHLNQKDKANKPYIEHVYRVASRFDKDNEKEEYVVALLHDVVEDSDVTFNDLLGLGFCKEIIEALELMTRVDNMNYEDYIIRIKTNEIARKVKISDLIDNSNLSRLENVTIQDVKRQEKYNRALKLLIR